MLNSSFAHQFTLLAVKGKESDPLRWNLSMRMMQLPNGPAVEPESWVPRMVANYTTMNLNLTDAFDNVGPLFDAVQEHENAWKNTLDGWADSYGPGVDVRKEFIGNLTNRISVITNYDTPITEDSERSVFAIEAKNEAALSKTLDKWMKSERDVKRREVGQYVIYEQTSKTNQVEEPQVDVIGFTSTRSTKTAKKPREQVLPNSAVTVALGHLMMASDVKYLTEILEGFAQRERLASSADYKQTLAMLDKLAPGEQRLWFRPRRRRSSPLVRNDSREQNARIEIDDGQAAQQHANDRSRPQNGRTSQATNGWLESAGVRICATLLWPPWPHRP